MKIDNVIVNYIYPPKHSYICERLICNIHIFEFKYLINMMANGSYAAYQDLIRKVVRKETGIENNLSLTLFVPSLFPNVRMFGYSPLRHYINNTVENNFIDEPTKNTLIEIYNAFRKCLRGISLFKHIWRMKYTPAFDYDCDLQGDSMDDIPAEKVFTLYQNGRIYRFSTRDCFNLLKSALLATETCTPVQRIPKNPYTNIEFNWMTRYNMYVFIRLNTYYTIPSYMQTYFSNGHSHTLMVINTPYIMTENSVNDYMHDATQDELVDDIYDMIGDFAHLFGEYDFIDREVEKETLEITRPVLKKYLMYIHTSEHRAQQYLRRSIETDIVVMLLHNTTYGRHVVRGRRRSLFPSVNTTTRVEITSGEEPNNDIVCDTESDSGVSI